MHEVINQGYDRYQLAPVAFKAQQAAGCEQITALADRGYFNGDQVFSCQGTGVAPVAPKALTSGNTRRGVFTEQDFVYDAEKDHYTFPAGQHLTNQGASPIRPLGRRLSIPSSDRVVHLSSQAAVHRRESEAGQAPENTKALTPCRIGPTVCLRPWVRDRPSNTRLDPQSMDGRHPLPDPNPRRRPNRDAPPAGDSILGSVLK